ARERRGPGGNDADPHAVDQANDSRPRTDGPDNGGRGWAGGWRRGRDGRCWPTVSRASAGARGGDECDSQNDGLSGKSPGRGGDALRSALGDARADDTAAASDDVAPHLAG